MRKALSCFSFCFGVSSGQRTGVCVWARTWRNMAEMVRPRILGFGLALLTLLLFSPVSRHDFINYDDPDYITENPMVLGGLSGRGVEWAFTSFHASNWHPLTWCSHMLDVQIFGLDPGAHHLGNVFLHALNAALLFCFCYRSTGRPWPSLVAAALFAWHPLRVQSVAWAAERKDVLSATFWLLTLLAYERYSRLQAATEPGGGNKPRWAYGLSLGSFLLGLLSKPMLVTVPFVLLLLDYWPLNRLRNGRLRADLPERLREKLPFFAASVVVSTLTWMAQRGEAVVSLDRLPFADRLGNAVLSYTGYLWKTLWPAGLSVLYPLPSRTPWHLAGLAMLFLAGVTVAVWRMRLSRPHWLVGWFWFLGTLVPVIGLVQVGGQAMADRYTYVPLIGLVWAAVWEVSLWVQTKRFPLPGAGLACAALLLAYGARTFQELGYWADSVTLFSRALAVTRNNAVAHSNLGLAFESRGNLTAAMREYERAVRINPHLAQARNNLGGLLTEQGNAEAALPHLIEALRLKPRSWQTHINYATALVKLGRTNEATEFYARAADLAPGDPRPHYAAGRAMLRQGQARAAVEHFRRALQADPRHTPSLAYLSRTLAANPDPGLRNGAEAVELAERALELTGENDAFLLDTLAMAYAEQNRFPQALAAIERAIALEQGMGDSNSVSELQGRMSRYQKGEPFRDPGTGPTGDTGR